MFGKKRSFLNKILILFIFGCIIGIGLIGMYIYKITTYRVEYGRLNIEDIIDANLLKVIRVDMDYLVDVPLEKGHYTAILPFTVTAEFDLNKIKVIENNDTVKIVLPKPEILVDQADEESIKVLRASGTANYSYIIKGFKIYAENFVKNAAIYNYNILQKANKKVKIVFKDILKDILVEEGKKLEVITSPVENTKREPVIKVRSEFHPVEINIYDENVKGHVQHDLLGFIFNIENINGVSKNSLFFYRVHPITIGSSDAECFLKKYINNYGVLFNPLMPKRRILIEYNDRKILSFFYTFNDWIYRAVIEGPNSNAFGEALPQFLDLVDNIKFLPNYTPKYQGKDIFGFLTKEIVWRIDSKLMKDYFAIFYIASLAPYCKKYKKYSYECYINPKWKSIYLITPDSNPLDSEPLVVTDEDGFNLFKDNCQEFWENIHKAIDNVIKKININDKFKKDEFKNMSKNNIITITYDYNPKRKLHRDRFIFIFKNFIVYYIPERFIFIQKPILEVYFFKDLKIQGVNGIFDEGCYFASSKNSKNSEKALESQALCQFLNDFVEYSFPAVFR